MANVKTETNVVPIRAPAAAKRVCDKKWGADVMAQNYCMVPSLLLRAQRRLGLSAQQLALIIHLCDFWWYDDKLPWPKKETLAERLGLTEKQIQRIVRALEERGYLKRIRRTTRHGQTSNGYDLSGLAEKLQELAPEFAEAKAAKRNVERRGGIAPAARKAHKTAG